MPNLPTKFSEWPQEAMELSPEDVAAMYGNGFAGIVPQPEEHVALREYVVSQGGHAYGSEAAHAFGLAESGKGKLILPYLSAEKLWPGCWPGPGQTTGDCVSWGTRNACMVTIGVEIDLGKPDEVTGQVEGSPLVSPEAIRQGVFATEPIYGHRGHRGQGADCGRLAQYVVKVGGMMVRQNYPDLGIDLTMYKSGIGAGWGGGGTPDAVSAIARQHAIRTATELEGAEQVRDFLANGYGVNTCSSLGFSSKRDENGFSEQKGSWAHSQAIIGYDDRPEIIAKYGEALCLWLNSWARWNGGGRRILGTNIDIPEGSYWARSSLCRKCYLIAFSGHAGWPRQNLPDYGVNFYGLGA